MQMPRGVGEREEVSGAGDRDEDGAGRGVARPEGRRRSTLRRRRDPASVFVRGCSHETSEHTVRMVTISVRFRCLAEPASL